MCQKNMCFDIFILSVPMTTCVDHIPSVLIQTGSKTIYPEVSKPVMRHIELKFIFGSVGGTYGCFDLVNTLADILWNSAGGWVSS
jgi:hypothetical protein